MVTIVISACKEGDIILTNEGEFGQITQMLNHIGSVQIRVLNRGEKYKTVKGREMHSRWRNSKRAP